MDLENLFSTSFKKSKSISSGRKSDEILKLFVFHGS